MVNSDYEIKLCDFGISSRCKPGARLTELCGTAAYIAPEVFSGEYAPFHSDVG